MCKLVKRNDEVINLSLIIDPKYSIISKQVKANSLYSSLRETLSLVSRWEL